MYYGDDRVYEVERHDTVEVRIDGHTYDGVVTNLHPKSSEVTVRYEDWIDLVRTTGNPKRKTARAHISSIDLIAKDM